MITIVEGNILDAKEKYIAHQCNCVTKYGKGLSKAIFDKYPYANIYSLRKNDDNFKWASTHHTGVSLVCGNGWDVREGFNEARDSEQKEKIIINMVAQYYPGKSKYKNDSVEKRKEWFKECLTDIAINLPELKDKKEKLAMPYNIGCGLGGGNWNEYYEMINDFAEQNNIDVVLYRLD